MQTKENKLNQESRTIASQMKNSDQVADASAGMDHTQNPYLTMQRKKLDTMFGDSIQRQMPEEEELLQGKFVSQLQAPEEEEPLQGKFVSQLQGVPEEEELLQGKFISQLQTPEEEEPLQGKFVSQLSEPEEEELLQGKFPLQRKPNNTGLPDEVKTKMESSLKSDFSDVKVHPDSSKATEVGALAYTQGSDVHFAPGQFKPDSSEGHQLIGHELTHVIQQREGRVQPTIEVAGMPVNDNPALEQEADIMGAKVAG